MSEPFKLRIESEADLAGLDAYLKSLSQTDKAQEQVDGSLEQIGQEAKKTEKTFGDLEREAQQARLAMRMLTPSDTRLPDLQRHIAAVDEQLGKMHGSQQRAAGSSLNMGNALLQGSRALQDMQYGLAGAVNNLEGIAAAMGLGAGVAGVVTVLAVAVQTLGPGIVEWFKSLGEAGASIEELKAPLEGFNTDTEIAEQRVRAFTESLKAEAEAAEAAAAALEHELEMLRARNALAGAKDQNAYDQKIREIEASDMPADEKARQKAAAQAAKEAEDLKRREEERAKQGDVLRGEAEAKERAAREMQRKADEAAKRRAEVQTREGLSEVTIPEKERALREAQGAYSAMTAEGVLSPEQVAELQRQVAEAQAALDKAKADRDAITPGDAAEENKKAQEAAVAADKARKDAEAAREAANRGQAKNSVENEADRERTKGRIDQIMWKGDEEAATANREKQEREEREAKRREAEQKRKEAEDRKSDEQARRERERQERDSDLSLRGDRAGDRQMPGTRGISIPPGGTAGATVAAHGDVTAQSLRNQGLGEAAKDLQQATSKLRDGATENEASQAAAAIRELAPLIGGMNQKTREQMSALLREVETLKAQIKNLR